MGLDGVDHGGERHACLVDQPVRFASDRRHHHPSGIRRHRWLETREVEGEGEDDDCDVGGGRPGDVSVATW